MAISVKNIIRGCFLFFMMTGVFLHPAWAASSSGQLIVFLQQAHSEVEQAFVKDALPEIETLAKEMGITLFVTDTRKGAPEEVTITPLIVFQNFRGRSVYQGRTTTIHRIRNFIRTSIYMPQEKNEAAREHLMVMKTGRAHVWSKLKVTPLTGSLPEGYDRKKGEEEALRYIKSGFSAFQYREKSVLGRSDRGFYMDIYPWRSEDGNLFLSLALYSQFHCKEPVFRQTKVPVTGAWKDRKNVYKRAAEIMEAAVKTIVNNRSTGDGFDPVPETVAVVSWEDLGFPLPLPPEKKEGFPLQSGDIPKSWVLAPENLRDAPVIQFRFPPPLDQYSGEVTRGTVQVVLPEDWKKNDPQGVMEVDMTSVTMGIPELDQTLQGELFLNTKTFPRARFDLSGVHGDSETFGYGKLAVGSIDGVLSLKGGKTSLTVPMEMEPVLDENGHPNLLIRGSFQIYLPEYEIEGADGPEPQKNTLIIDANLKLIPENEK